MSECIFDKPQLIVISALKAVNVLYRVVSLT